MRFPLLDEDGAATGESLLVWTTTPWTLPGNVAVAVAPDGHLRARQGRRGDPDPGRAAGREGAGGGGRDRRRSPRRLRPGRPPLRGPGLRARRRRPDGLEGSPTFRVLAGDFVTTEDGTGLVHIAPAFGEDDYAVAAANGIFDPTRQDTLYNPVAPNGHFDSRVVGFADRFVKDPEVTRELIADLERRGLLFREQVYEHAYPHCWRCGTPLLYYATSSWYIATSEVKDQLLANNETIGWRPEHVKHGRFGKWLENNVDWALSRDRYWGTPLPVWVCTDHECDEVASAPARSPSCASAPAPRSPRTSTVPTSTRSSVPCEKCGGEMRRVESVIDTWYDSGAMPFAQFHYPFENQELFAERFPADYICEAQDQTRGWFYTLLAESTLLFGESSFRNCVCLGLILDPEGQKMSKSNGNVVDPWEVIATHGADAFRWYYLATQQPWAGYRFSVDTVGESVRQFMLTLWNTYSFWVLYANAENLGPARLPRPRRSPPPTSTAGRSRACRRRSRPSASGWTTSTAPAPARRSPSTSRSSPTGTCGSRGGASGRATGPPSRPCATACWRRWRCWRRSPPSSPTRSTSTSPAARSARQASCRTRSTCATSPTSTRRSPTPSWRPGWRRCG